MSTFFFLKIYVFIVVSNGNFLDKTHNFDA